MTHRLVLASLVMGGLLTGCSVDRLDSKGMTALARAVEADDLATARELLGRGADVNLRVSAFQNTPLHFAVARGDAAMVRLLLDRGADVRARNYVQGTPLHSLVPSPTVLEIANLLIAKGADIQATDIEGALPLHMVFQNWSPPADPPSQSMRHISTDHLLPSGETAQKTLAMAKMMLAKGVSANARTRVGGHTLLHKAAASGFIDVVSMLLDGGAAIDARNEIGRTPLSVAAETYYLQVPKLLLDRGADVNARDKQGLTPMFYALDDVVPILAAYGGRE